MFDAALTDLIEASLAWPVVLGGCSGTRPTSVGLCSCEPGLVGWWAMADAESLLTRRPDDALTAICWRYASFSSQIDLCHESFFGGSFTSPLMDEVLLRSNPFPSLVPSHASRPFYTPFPLQSHSIPFPFIYCHPHPTALSFFFSIYFFFVHSFAPGHSVPACPPHYFLETTSLLISAQHAKRSRKETAVGS